ncbi:HAMP domain-containing sensor histidine kinase [Lentilactobacillus sp. Marseille-Q4993]|uniref:sensor histidine kinase n=1 Tax=Lentilactobacillus sp. Marseille-Q4993 TaxID=3039492 RepID=UPI0024BC8741|nr:HAMP domain-containing sensor histidine kinase [Lentilactobacillus sp. Marseille-Q4993]
MNKLNKQILITGVIGTLAVISLIIAVFDSDSFFEYVSLILGVVWLLAMGQLLITNYQSHRVLRRIHHSVDKLVNDNDAIPILVRPGDDYKRLADSVNDLIDKKENQDEESNYQASETEKIMNVLPIGVMVIGENKDVIYSNSQMETILSKPIGEEKHLYTDDITNYELLTMIDSVFDKKETQKSEITEVADDPKTTEVQVMYNHINSSFHIIVIAYDITEVINIKQMQIDFLRNASHELKTPVTAISGFAKTLLDGAMEDHDDLAEFLTIIDKQSEQLTSLINDILTISHVQNHESSAVNLIDLASFIDAEFKTQQNQANKLNVSLINEIEPDLQVRMDNNSLQRIARNLISNAIKYNRQGGQVTVNANREGDIWYFKVADTGTGIAQKEIGRIFERFYRTDASRNKQKIAGTGLGLSIVKELVDSLSGKITVESQRGVGTTFTVRLPYVKG